MDLVPPLLPTTESLQKGVFDSIYSNVKTYYPNSGRSINPPVKATIRLTLTVNTARSKIPTVMCTGVQRNNNPSTHLLKMCSIIDKMAWFNYDHNLQARASKNTIQGEPTTNVRPFLLSTYEHPLIFCAVDWCAYLIGDFGT